MPEYDSNEWQHAKGEVVIDVTPRHMVDLWVSCTKTVQVLGVPGTAGTSAIVLRTGSEFRFRGPIKGFAKIVIRGTGETPFGLKALHSPRQDGEPLSDEKPPVLSLPEPSNLVAKMRRLAAEHHSRNRMPVLEPEDGPSFSRYEFDDDDEVLFEEEAWEKHQAEKREKAKQKAEAKARKEAEAGAAPQEGLQPAPAPSTPPDKGEDPPAAKAAE